VAEIHQIIAGVKDALESGAAPRISADPEPPQPPTPAAPIMQRAELATSLARELEEVGGKFLGILTPDEVAERITALAGEIGARTVALGEGVACDMDAIGESLERAGCTIVRTVPVADSERAAMRERVANSDLGIAEADYAIASTGTVSVVSTDSRPSSLTLLPPASLVIVQIGRIMPTLAQVLAALGPERIAAHRMTLITGPSRTADIEKRIVLGVHGPKSLYLIVVWARDE
jgi:L-lactate dehydrogenase complex protein LldG